VKRLSERQPETNANWVTASVPTGTATFDAINTMLLSAGAPTYSYTINAGVTFDILGAGIVNNSANAPNFLNNGTLNFSNSSTAQTQTSSTTAY
jgi:hypothetical protein